MRRVRHSPPSPAFVVAVLALVAAVAGTAVAGTDVHSAVSKKQTKKIAKKQIDKLAPGLSVAHADTADSATRAGSADAVGGNRVARINLRAASVAAGTPFLQLSGFRLEATCAAADETVIADTTVAGGELSAISTDASTGAITRANDDTFNPGDDQILSAGGVGSDRIYNIHYSGGDGRNVSVQLVTEDAIGANDCIYTGFAIGS